jgi:hypothetical protein
MIINESSFVRYKWVVLSNTRLGVLMASIDMHKGRLRRKRSGFGADKNRFE